MPFTPNYDDDEYFIPDSEGNLIPFSHFWKGVEQPSRVLNSPKEYHFECVHDHRFKNELSNENLWSNWSNSALLMDRWHYTHSSKVMPKYVFGIFHPDGYDMSFGGLSGVIMYGKPAMNDIYKLYSDEAHDVIELRRMVLVNATPKNTESWFLGKSLKWLAENSSYDDASIVVTYADAIEGHTGVSYRACGMKYDGLSGNAPAIMMPDGSIKHDRLLRTGDKDGNLSASALKLRHLINSGIAWRVEMPSKHRYHIHLPQHETILNKHTNRYIRVLRSANSKECKWCSAHSKSELDEQTKPKVETKDDLFAKIEKGWSKETSFLPDDWTTDNPSWGQCAVSSLIVQEHLGGELMKCRIVGKEYIHYYNVLPDGTIVDLTKKQFAPDVKFTKPIKQKRDDILQWKKVEKRYQLLKQNMAKAN
jgi:hypothetical protein